MARSPRFSGFNQLAAHPVLVGLVRSGVPAGGEHEGDPGVRVHNIEVPWGLGTGRYSKAAELDLGNAVENPPATFPAGAGGWTASGASPSSRAPLTRGGGGGFYPVAGGYYPYWGYPYYYAGYYPWGPARYGMPGRQDCRPPISGDCTVLYMTKRWAIVCFMWAYNLARERYGNNLTAVVQSILRDAIPCDIANTEASRELQHRVRLASAVLMRGEGVDVPLPRPPNATRPPDADRYRQPWIRALMTGWV